MEGLGLFCCSAQGGLAACPERKATRAQKQYAESTKNGGAIVFHEAAAFTGDFAGGARGVILGRVIRLRALVGRIARALVGGVHIRVSGHGGAGGL